MKYVLDASVARKWVLPEEDWHALLAPFYIDPFPELSNNIAMAIEIREPTQEEADNQAMLDHAFKGAPLDPEVAKRVHERAEAVRAKLPLTNIAVDLIREIREE